MSPSTQDAISSRYQPLCGRHNEGGLSIRISGATQGEAQFAEWPHMCAVLSTKELAGTEVNLYQCGGSLIAPGIVLTAAHCAKK